MCEILSVQDSHIECSNVKEEEKCLILRRINEMG
jgi:hypothetical protein